MTTSRSLTIASFIAALAFALFGHWNAAHAGDNLIVPGERIGDVRLCMDVCSLYAVKGDPKSFRSCGSSIGACYDWSDLSVYVEGNKVVEVSVHSGGSQNYSTGDGLSAGVSELALRAKRPRFFRREYMHASAYMVYYDDGLRLQVGYVISSVSIRRRDDPEFRQEPGDFNCYKDNWQTNYYELAPCRRR